MVKVTILTLLFLSVSGLKSNQSFAAQASTDVGGKKNDEQYWAETGLNFAVVENKFRGSCYKNQKGFVACVQAINVAARLMSTPGNFATKSEIDSGTPYL